MTDIDFGLLFLFGQRIPYSLLLFLAAGALVLVLTPAVRVLALRVGAVDHPGPRRIHAEPVATLGGVAIAVAVLVVAWLGFLLPGPLASLDSRPLVGLTIASLPVLLLGIVDDLRGSSPWVKIAVQVAVAGILFQFGFGIPVLSNPMGGTVSSGALNFPITAVWVVLVMNAINLIDGLDGLAAGAVSIASLTLWFVGRTHGDLYVMFLTALLAGATVGFLRWNFPPARIFMGDTGSQFLGLVLAAASLIENRKGTVTITLLFPLVAMGVPIIDSALALIRRVRSGHPVFRGDAEHIHHRLLRIGLSRRRALMVLWYLCAYLGIMAVVVEALPRAYGALVLALLAMGLYLAFGVLEFLDRRPPGDDKPPR